MLDCGFSPLMSSLSDRNMRLGDVLFPPGIKQWCLYLSGDWYRGRLTQAEATFQDKDGPIGLQLGRAGQTYGRLLQGNQPYRMPAVSPGATGSPSSLTRRSSDWPAAGPRWKSARPIAQSNRPCRGPEVGP